MRPAAGFLGGTEFEGEPAAIWSRMIHGGEPRLFQRGAHPPSRATPVRSPFLASTEAVELCACLHAHAHQLRLIHHPKRVVIQ